MLNNPISQLFLEFLRIQKEKNAVVIFDLDKIQSLKITEDDFDRMSRNTLSAILDNYYIKDHLIEVKCDNRVVKIPLAKLIVNMCFWKPYFKFNKRVRYEDIIDVPDEITFKGWVSKQIEATLVRFKESLFTDKELFNISDVASIILKEFVNLDDHMSTLTCNTFSLFDIIELKNRNPAFNSCINYKLDETRSIPEIESDLNAGMKMVKDAILTDSQSHMTPYINSNVYKTDQLTQTFFSIGLRSDADNKVIPHIVNTNFINGFRNIADYYSECEVARFATILKDRNVGDSGYLSREFDLLTHAVIVDTNVNDCGTKTYLPYHIENDFQLNMIHNKYYVDEKDKLHVIDSKKDKHLIGKTIRLRSIVSCNCKTPTVCKTCFGNRDYNQLELNVGACVSINMISRFTQASMSAKHSTTVSSMEIEDKTIHEYFVNDKEQLYLKEDVSTSDLEIRFDREYIEDILERAKNMNKNGGNDDDDDEDENSSANDPLRRMVLIDKIYDKERDTYDKIKREIILDDTYLQFSDQVIARKKLFSITHNLPYAVMSLKNFPKDEPIFDITYIAKNVSAHITSIRKVMRCNDIGPFDQIASKYIRMMTEIIETAGYRDIHFNNVECIYHQLIKSVDDITKRPNFLEKNPIIHLMKMKPSIVINSFSDGLAHEDLSSHFKDINVYSNDAIGVNDIRYNVSDMYHIPKVMEVMKEISSQNG